MTSQRKKAEELVYKVMDTLDPSGQNSDYYKKLFSEMSDAQFIKFIDNPLAFKFQVKIFEIEPTMKEIDKAAKVLGIPLLEKVNLPYMYSVEGKPIKSQECLVAYAHIKKMKQFISKKNAMSVDIAERDMKTGLLVSFDKNGKTSDRETESLAVLGFDATLDELTHAKADSMKAKSAMYSAISNVGQVSLSDLPKDIDDSLSRNYLNAYLLGSQLLSNLVSDDYYLPLTLKDKKNKIERK